MNLRLRLYLKGLVPAVPRTEDLDEVLKPPGLNVIVHYIHTMNEALDCEAIVTDYITVYVITRLQLDETTDNLSQTSKIVAF